MTRIRLGWWAAIVALLSAMTFTVAVACGDDNNGDNGDDGDTTPASQATPGDATNGDGDDDDDDDNDNGNGGGDVGEFRDAFERFRDGTFTVTFDVSGEEFAGISSFTMAKDGEDRIALIFEGDGGAEQFSGRFIQDGDESAVCVDSSALGDLGDIPGIDASGDELCFGPDSPFGAGVGDLTDDLDFEDDTEVISSSRETIAGEDADCYETRDADGTVTTGCIGRDTGAILRIVDADGSSFEASEVSGDVDESAFDIPELTEFPGFTP